jgi:hypothetical protein
MDGMSGQQIYENFQNGTGGSGLADGAAQVQQLIKSYEARADSITQLTVRMESAWQGDAAGAARRGAGPLAVEHGLAAPEMNTAQKLITSQVSAYDNANNSVVPVPPTPDKPGLWDNITSLGGAGRTYEQEMAEVNAANDHNVAVMSSYENVTSTNTSGMPRTYGSISPDYSAIGVVQPQTPPTPPPVSVQPPPTSTGRPPGGSSPSSPGTPGPTTPGPSPTSPSVPPGPRSPAPGQTDPGGFVPTPTGPPGPGGTPGPGGGGGSSGPGFGPGFVPATGFGSPGGGGSSGGGSGAGTGTGGGRGSSGGAGGRAGFGSGGGGAASEEGGRAGARPGTGGLAAGGAAAAEAAAARGAAGAGGRGAAGGMPMGAGGRGKGDEDTEHKRPSFLVEADPDETFGTDEVTAPPVIGE